MAMNLADTATQYGGVPAGAVNTGLLLLIVALLGWMAVYFIGKLDSQGKQQNLLERTVAVLENTVDTLKTTIDRLTNLYDKHPDTL